MELENLSNRDQLATIDERVMLDVERRKRVLHFSDGVIEEFEDSGNEQQGPDTKEQTAVVESELQWAPWFAYKASKAGTSILQGCDYVGESLASFLGITTPKYSNEINEFRRIQAENDEVKQTKAEYASWMGNENPSGEVIIKDVAASNPEKF